MGEVTSGMHESNNAVKKLLFSADYMNKIFYYNDFYLNDGPQKMNDDYPTIMSLKAHKNNGC
jgi:hypothetical protein